MVVGVRGLGGEVRERCGWQGCGVWRFKGLVVAKKGVLVGC